MVGSDEVGLLGELFMLPYCTSPHLGLPRPHLLLMQNMSRIRKEKSSKDKCSGSFLCALTNCTAVFLTGRAAARYRALASIIPGRERFSWNLSF